MLTREVYTLFAARMLRMFAYGFLSIILVLYLAEIGLSEIRIGLLLTLTLLGDTVISLFMTTTADRIGRRKMLFAGACLMLFAGTLFVLTRNFYLLIIAAIIGVISPSGYEVGPFLSIEQAALSQLISNRQRTHFFAWYNLAGAWATALGTFFGGLLAQGLQQFNLSAFQSYRVIMLCYAVAGGMLAFLFTRLSSTIEASGANASLRSSGIAANLFGLHQSRRVVFKLASMFTVDAFAGGFIVQSVMAYWFHLRFGVEPALLGTIFMAANILAGLSALAAARVALRIGLINTMVFTHLPSNILLIFIPLMPNLSLAIALLLLRFCISQMDVPTRQSYTMAVVSPDERSAAAGITGIARTVGAALSPMLAVPMLANTAFLGFPFFIAGGLKIIYDLTLWYNFRTLKPPEER